MAGKQGLQPDHPGEMVTLTIDLPADCRMGAQAAIKGQYMSAVNAGGVVLDGSAVARVDTAALQLLMLFRRDMTAAGGTWHWAAASAVLQEAVSLLGLTHVLEMPATVPA